MSAEPTTVPPEDSHAIELCRRLVRVDTSNPPGRERACIELLANELAGAGLEPRFFVAETDRPNLVVRVHGRGEAPPLLLHGHADVVPADPAEWRHEPFGADVVDGEIWGRGTLDMKGGLAMLTTVVLQLAGAATSPPGDVIFVVNSDEEAGGDLGAEWPVRHHPELFADVRHAISEFGGYPHHIAGRRLYPIQVSQKRRCLLRVTVRSEPGHAAAPKPGRTAGRLAQTLLALDRARLPIHLAPPVRLMFESMSDGLPAPLQKVVALLTDSRTAGAVLRGSGPLLRDLDPLVRNTAAVTRVESSGAASNVIPGTASIDLDGRLIPGCEPSDLVDELRSVLPRDAEIEVLRADPPAHRLEPDLALLPLLADVLREQDPGGHPFPAMTPGMTDARHYDRLGIQTYGFLPMQLPKGLAPELLHAPNERVPAAALPPGVSAIRSVVKRYRTRD